MTEQEITIETREQLRPAELTFSAYLDGLRVQNDELVSAEQKFADFRKDRKEKRGDPLVKAIDSWMMQEVVKCPIVGDRTTVTEANIDDVMSSDMKLFLGANNLVVRDRLEIKKGRWINAVNGQPE